MSESGEATQPKGISAHDGRMVFVFAGSFAEAEHWRTNHTTIPPYRMRYVRDSRVLRGYRGQRGVLWGSFWQRRDCRELLDIAKVCEIEWIE
jgi:hypothetical protein